MKGIIYLIVEISENAEKYKIGITKNSIEKRISQLRTGNPNTLNVINTFESPHYKIIENFLHKKHYSKKLNLEWFDLSDNDVLTFIKDCQQFHDNIDYLFNNNSFLNKK